jgi:hypothetical protein
MAIKSIKIKSFFLMGLICIVLISSFSSLNFNVKNSESFPGKLRASKIVFVDKVYTFTLSNPILRFDNELYFEKYYFYDIYVAVVTPHTCTMNITLWDPEGEQYELSFEGNMTQEDYRRIPFGAALSGNYSIQFEVLLTENLNVHLKIESSIKCLADSISSFKDAIYYNVSKFYNGDSLVLKTTTKTDRYYKLYFQRVSPISIALSNHVIMDHFVLDSRDLLFNIYQNVSLGYSSYYFGTATEGLYTINITIYCEVPSVNIAICILEKDSISDVLDPDIPDSPPGDGNVSDHTQSTVRYYIPKEWTIGVMTFIGLSVSIPVILIIYRRKKNSMKL